MKNYSLSYKSRDDLEIAVFGILCSKSSFPVAKKEFSNCLLMNPGKIYFRTLEKSYPREKSPYFKIIVINFKNIHNADFNLNFLLLSFASENKILIKIEFT